MVKSSQWVARHVVQTCVLVHFEQPGSMDSHYPVSVFRQVSGRQVEHFLVPVLHAVHLTPQFVQV